MWSILFFLCTHKKTNFWFIFLCTHNKYYYYASIEIIYINIFLQILNNNQNKIEMSQYFTCEYNKGNDIDHI